MADKKVTESFKVKRQVLVSGHEGAELILRVDDILKCAPRQRAPDHCMWFNMLLDLLVFYSNFFLPEESSA